MKEFFRSLGDRVSERFKEVQLGIKMRLKRPLTNFERLAVISELTVFIYEVNALLPIRDEASVRDRNGNMLEITGKKSWKREESLAMLTL